MKTRYTTAADQDGYWVMDSMPERPEDDRVSMHSSLRTADSVAKALNREWAQEVQACKDVLLKAGALNDTQNQAIQSKLDTALGESWATEKKSWGHGRNKKARGA